MSNPPFQRPSLRQAAPPPRVMIDVDGTLIPVPDGAMLAAALLDAGYRTLRYSPRDGGARGAFCYMGVCQECLILVDGRRQQACRVTIHDGMRISLITAPTGERP